MLCKPTFYLFYFYYFLTSAVLNNCFIKTLLYDYCFEIGICFESQLFLGFKMIGKCVLFVCYFVLGVGLSSIVYWTFFYFYLQKTATSPVSTAGSPVGTPACSPDHLLVGRFTCPPTRPIDSSHSNTDFCFIVGLDFIIL